MTLLAVGAHSKSKTNKLFLAAAAEYFRHQALSTL